jgi:hypothetical protein
MSVWRRSRRSAEVEAAVEEPPAPAPELVEKSALDRARAQQAEAQRDLARLRERYWSGERLLEESKLDIPWWEHPDADPYAILNLVPGASIEDAAAARRAIARRCHPDTRGRRHDPEWARRQMVAANAAYDRLRRALQPV